MLNGQLTNHEAAVLYATKIIGIPKDVDKIRAIMMAGTEAKIIWSIFVHSGYKKGIDKTMFTNQYGSKQSGCEKVIHQMRLIES